MLAIYTWAVFTWLDENVSSTKGDRVPIAAVLASFCTFLGLTSQSLKRKFFTIFKLRQRKEKGYLTLLKVMSLFVLVNIGLGANTGNVPVIRQNLSALPDAVFCAQTGKLGKIISVNQK